jgi:hypothetical protein
MNHHIDCKLKPQQDFVREHHDVFKVPVAMLEDIELNAQLSKIISELLASIRSNIKAKVCQVLPPLCKSFMRCTCLADNINCQTIEHHGDRKIPCSSLQHQG